MFELISLLILGSIAGTLAGLLGVGGGVIIVPVLAWLLRTHAEIPSTHLMHVALATSLATIVFTATSSIYAHHQQNAVLWPVMWQLTPGIFIGSIFGTIIASWLATDTLKSVFATFLLLIAIQLNFGFQATLYQQLPKRLGMSFIGMVIGSISALIGIGGGLLTVPVLAWCNTPLRQAIATSAACGLPIAIAGTIGYIIMGWHSHLPWSSGYVYWPAVLTIVPTSLVFAPFGAKLTHSLPINILKKFFALFLSVVSMKMLFN